MNKTLLAGGATAAFIASAPLAYAYPTPVMPNPPHPVVPQMPVQQAPAQGPLGGGGGPFGGLFGGAGPHQAQAPVQQPEVQQPVQQPVPVQEPAPPVPEQPAPVQPVPVQQPVPVHQPQQAIVQSPEQAQAPEHMPVQEPRSAPQQKVPTTAVQAPLPDTPRVEHPFNPPAPGASKPPQGSSAPNAPEHPFSPPLNKPGEGPPVLPGQAPQLQPSAPQQHLAPLPARAPAPHDQDAPKPVAVPAPKQVPAEPDAVDAAKAVPPLHVDPVAPPPPPDGVVDPVRQAEQVSAHAPEGDRDDRGVARPQHWTYVDDDHGHPHIYNPVGRDMTFRYFYRSGFHDVFVPAGANVVLDIDDPGVYPFTAVGGDYVTTGSFTGGGFVPTSYDNVAVDVPAAGRTVQVSQVQLIGHDDTRPVGQQDAMMLDGTTLAYGTVRDPQHVDLQKVQTLPGVGPMDDGTHWVDTALVRPMPTSHARTWALGGSLAALLASAGTIAGVIIRRRRPAAQPGVVYSSDPYEPTQWMNGPY
jgi:hypothetical protein